MSITHTITHTINAGGNQISKSEVFSADAEENRDFVVPAAGAITAAALAIDVSQLKSIFVVSDVAVTVQFNKSSGNDQFVLVANEPLIWNTKSVLPLPFTGDIVSITASNAGGADALLQIRMLVDATV